MPLFSMVTFIHSHRSSDASRPHKQEIPRHLQQHHQVCSFLMPCATTSSSCTTAGTLCWCARAGGLARSEWAVRGKAGYDPSCKQAEKEFNKYTYTDLALETKFGLIIMAAGAIPVIVVDHYVLPYQDLLDWETFNIRIPEHQAPRGICGQSLMKVVEMMQRRVVFVLGGVLQALSTQVHTGEGVRINLFSGDNAWQVGCVSSSCHPPPSTNHHCSGGMNRRALPCDDHPATPVRLWKQQQQLTPHHKQAMSNVTAAYIPLSFSPSLTAITTTTAAAAANTPSTADAAAAENAPPPPASLAAEHIPQPTNPSPAAACRSWLPAAGNRWRQHKLHFRLEAAAEVIRTHRQQDEGNVEATCHACQLHPLHTWYVRGRLREYRWRMMGGYTHDGLGGAAVDTHVHGHGGHIQPQRRSYVQGHIRGGEGSRHERPIIIINLPHFFLLSRSSTSAPQSPSPSTAQPTSHAGRHQLQSGVRQTLHMSVALMKSVEEAHEAVEPTTMMTMTSDEGPCIPLPSNRPTKQPSERAKDTAWQGAVCFHLFHQQQQQQQQPMSGCIVDELALCLSFMSTSPSSSSSLVANSSGCGHGCGGCDVRRCAVASRDDAAAAGGRWPISSQALMTRAGRYTHTQLCERRRHKADVVRVSPTDFPSAFPNQSPLLCVIIIISLPHVMCSC
ncbi:hypothetical protein PTSG_11756 [Salpingoeca rosetta]|uniref:Exostosin GT47 domain-containing protein n=1 Tax=Salpingoeca rosetta (strain ATCC 50818 / BSB-021) TaxID=946362 RepID=F2TYC4_SALR5|nr:uncharacterized protein PTSG_11756 [Salpingoeca rosetta]EGD78598.1 hypothetical protein PTSG_11756 [Salpingoeca rosetta]|eukprot:XP_004997556.1 hypothetical protein PTSG_11756 [Salpingoeca rosetta]